MIRPASFFKRLLGPLLPPQVITAKVWAEKNVSENKLCLTPSFFFGDERLSDSELLSPSMTKINGHRCVMDPGAVIVLSLLKRSPRNCSATEAREILCQLEEKNVAVIRPNGVPYRISPARFTGSLRQTGATEAIITASVIDDQGVVADRPNQVTDTSIITETRLITIPVTNASTQKVLLGAQNGLVVTNDEMPSLVKAVQGHADLRSAIKMEGDISTKRVFDHLEKKQFTVSGGEGFVTLTESLIFKSEDQRSITVDAATVREAHEKSQRYIQTHNGWVDQHGMTASDRDRDPVWLPGNIVGEMIPELPDHLRAKTDQAQVHIDPDVAQLHQVHSPTGKPEIRVSGTRDEIRLETAAVYSNGKSIPLEALRDFWRHGRKYARIASGWAKVSEEKLHEAAQRASGIVPGAGKGVVFTGEQIPETLERLSDSVSPDVSIALSEEVRANHRIHRGSTRSAIYVTGDTEHIEAQAEVIYEDGARIPLSDAVKATKQKKRYSRTANGWAKIDEKETREAADGARRINPQLEHGVSVQGQDIPELLTSLRNRSHWDVYISKQVEGAHRVVDEKPSWRFTLGVYSDESGSGLTLATHYDQAQFKLDGNDVLEAVHNGERWLRNSNTWMKLDTDTAESLNETLFGEGLIPKNGQWHFPARLRDRFIEVFSRLGTIEHTESYNQFLLKLEQFERIEETPLPKGLKSGIELRPYQKHGYNWLCFLEEFGLNGILADDMGLGKTLQTLAAIARVKEKRKERLPTLVICPSSVMMNWQAEVARFFRNLYPIVYAGPERTRKRLLTEEGSRADIVITSYNMAAIDHEFLNERAWRYVILDEAHYIRNPDAQRTKAIKTIHATARLALTGTPVQNKAEELWSIFDFLMPGYLGKRAHFVSAYGKLGKSAELETSVAPLKKKIRPFVMRRMKTEVAKDLPPKLMIERFAELTSVQLAQYKVMLGREDVQQMLRQVDARQAQKMKLHILQAYAALRKICNHPGLLTGSGKLPIDQSGKLESLQELLEEVEDGEHRTLLFCQSTEMLNVIEAHLPDWGHSFLRLDGSTPSQKRQGLVDQFNKSDIRCFLISTQAGGTGLNLTGADTVIFYDHDWNPANDRQAEDRAYRIGQTRTVTVYRLITKGTIEEKIIKIQKQKQTLAEALINIDEDGFKDLTREELLDLFKLDK
jgi:superfamily II DNA or RNA helicase